MTAQMQRRETRTLPDGRFAVLTFEVERTNHSYFAWQLSVMRSEQAWREGENEEWTRDTDKARRLFPEVDPRFFDLHLADADTGTPMHARANASYYLSGRWAAHAREQVIKAAGDKYGIYSGELIYEGEDPANPARRYVKALEEWDALPILDIERQRAASVLHVEVPDLRVFEEIVIDEETGESERVFMAAETQSAIDAFIDALIEGWEAAARDLREWIAAEPADEKKPVDEDQTEFERELEGGLRVHAVFAEHDAQPWGEGRTAPRYNVTVTCGDLKYESPAWGSQADFEEDRYRARQMAFMVLDEMLSAARDPDEFASMASEGATRERLKRITTLLDAAEEFEDVLTLNEATIEAYR